MADDKKCMVGEINEFPIPDSKDADNTDVSLTNINLKREIGIIGGSALLVGTIIGSGIFASPTSVAEYTGSTGASLTVWVGCGVIAILSALSYCELGSMYPNATGGEYYYLNEAFGPIPAFLYAYTNTLVVKPSSLSIVALVCGQYILIAAVGHDIPTYSKLIAAGVIAIILVINCASVSWSTRIQVVFTAAKLVAIAIIVITGLVRLGQGYTGSFQDSFNGTTNSVSRIGYAFYSGLWAFDGWNNLNYVTEEMTNPIRDLPLSIMIGIPMITILYVMVNVAYLTVMTTVQLAKSQAVAVNLANQLYGVMAWIIPALVSCSTFGAANGSAFTGGRVVYAAAKKSHFPRLLAMIHRKTHTPLPGLIFSCFVATLMLIPESSNFDSLVNYFSFSTWTFYGATFAALIWLRIRKPRVKRPYKVFIVWPVIVLLCSVYLVIAPFCDYPWESFYCLIFMLSGLIFYFSMVKYHILPAALTQAFDKLTYKIQLAANLSLPSEEIEGDIQF